MRIFLAAALVLAVAAAPAPARADDEIVQGSVVKIELREIYVNLGAGQGVAGGTPIRLKRSIKLRHPVTRAAIEDWLPVGSATVTQAGTALSRAVVGELVTAIRVGDIAEVLVSRAPARPPAPPTGPTPPPGPTPPAPPAPPGPPPVDPATREVLELFAAQSGQPLDARIAAWARYLSTHPESPYAASIRADLDALEQLREQLGPASEAQSAGSIETVDHEVPGPTDEGAAFPVVFVLTRPERVASAYLHFRSRDRRTYRRELLTREHDIYLRGVVPAEVVRAPGVEYFVEVATPSGEAGLALGSPEAPVRVAVRPPPLLDRLGDGDEAGRTTVTIGGEYLDFATHDQRAGDRRDRMASAAIGVSYEIGEAVQRVGVGMGAIGGSGGFADLTWSDMLAAPEAGLRYGRADVELGQPKLAAGLAWIAGVGKRGFGMGVEARGRVGARRGTNLELLAQRLPEVGWLASARLGARPARDLLLGLTVGATDQPNRGDTAAKLVTELAWIGLPWLVLRVQGSWQGRSADHGGFGGGAAAEVTW